MSGKQQKVIEGGATSPVRHQGKLLVGLSGRVLGDDHPLKRKIIASFLKCFDEQLDWSLDDIPDDYLEYHALLLEGGCAAARRRGVR